jgi:hypothetical protein
MLSCLRNEGAYPLTLADAKDITDAFEKVTEGLSQLAKGGCRIPPTRQATGRSRPAGPAYSQA